MSIFDIFRVSEIRKENEKLTDDLNRLRELMREIGADEVEKVHAKL